LIPDGKLINPEDYRDISIAVGGQWLEGRVSL